MNETFATVSKDKLSVRHSIRPDVQREFLTIDIAGWDDVEKLSKKILTFDGRDFAFCGWNSDRNEMFFFRLLHGNLPVAFIKN